ncbi:hypothetical protein H1C71_012876, partial [Ictidomys tridecemlineatus]
GGGLAQPPGSTFELHPAADTRCSEMASIPQVRGLHLRGSSRLFTTEVRSVIAGMENSFLSLTFIYSLIKEAFAHVGLAARSWRPTARCGGVTAAPVPTGEWQSAGTKAREAWAPGSADGKGPLLFHQPGKVRWLRG